VRPVVVLGATGSVGRQTIEVCEHLGLRIAGLAVGSPTGPALELARKYPDASFAIAGGSPTDVADFERAASRPLGRGPHSICDLAATAGVTVVNGIVGAAGLRPTIAALEAGNRLALANKESLVAGGPLVTDALRNGGGELIPVDSEHSALHQLLDGRPGADVASLLLTASGGPFRGWTRDAMDAVTPQQALAHPTWNMGGRITVDSATLVNKGLEVIEAHVLFGFAFDAIDVVVHPQSIVHSLITLNDGALLAHVGVADMRIPIQYALTAPEHLASVTQPFRLAGRSLTFEEVDRHAFPALDLAYAAGREGGVVPAVFNAADEVAVAAFLQGRLGFNGIVRVIELAMDGLSRSAIESVDHVLEVDREARHRAAGHLAGVC
jgi:1-deoxy-D-xylulose-5-phosphate reductoisomerase